jgi:hypothetical protein
MSPSPSPAVDADSPLKVKLAKAIGAFNEKRVTILKKAFDEGGDDEVDEVLKEFDALRDAYFEILQRELDANNPRYTELTSAAKDQADQLGASIDALEKAAAILNGINGVISAVGKMLIVLGV